MLRGDRLSILIPLIHFNPTHTAGSSKAEFCRLSCSARQSVPIPEYKKNLGLIIDRLQELGAAVMVITPPPVDDQARIKLAVQVRAVADHHQLSLLGLQILLVPATQCACTPAWNLSDLGSHCSQCQVSRLHACIPDVPYVNYDLGLCRLSSRESPEPESVRL